MTEEQLWEWMMDGNYPPGWPEVPRQRRVATAVLAHNIEVLRNSIWRRKGIKEVWPAGKKVRVVMASRFGDVGITDDLNATHGYHYRTPCIKDTLEGPMGNIDIEPAGLLTDIQPA